ncbi:MAG TPA: amidohydrolase family protein, partial [Polyangiaceae bacterium]|nr:amidohydrolase family protein [Polyangiaceae bacterium]
MKDVLLLDGHCHLASTRYIPESFLSGAAANMAARAKAYGNKTANQGMLTDVLVRQHQDHTGDVLVREMDAAGIARTVLLYPDFGLALDGCPEPEVAIEEHLAVCERHAGRFELFAGVDPRRERAFERFERFVGAPHLKGLKLYPACGYSASDAALDPFYELCGARGMPVLFHSGPTTPALFYEFTAPFDVDRAAKRFPRVNFIIGHGGVHDTEQASLLCAHRPNVFLD